MSVGSLRYIELNAGTGDPKGEVLSTMNDAGEFTLKLDASPSKVRAQIVEDLLEQIGSQDGMTLLVDGLAGTGKTHLLRSLATAAADRHQSLVTFVRADEIESGEPYSFIERFVASCGVPDWHFTPDEDTSTVPLARECIRRLVMGVDGPERLIVMDDAQWIDEESRRVLRYFIPRVTRRGVTLAFGVRSPHMADSFGEFLLRLVTENIPDTHYHLEPFSLQEIASYTLERLGVGISLHTAQRLLEESKGTFFGVESLLNSLTKSEISKLHLAWDAPTRVVALRNDPLLHQFTQLSNAAQRTVEIVCLAGHEIEAENLQAACQELQEPLELAEAVEAGVLATTGFGASIMPHHTLLAQAVNDTIGVDRTRAVFRALAKVTSGYRSLRHTLLGAEEWNDELKAQVADFVFEAAEKGTLTIAADVLRAALNVAEEPDDRAELLESLGLVHMRAKNGYLMLDLLPEIEALPYSVLREFIAVVLAAHKVGENLPMERAQKLLMTRPKNPDEHATLGFFAFMVVILTMRSMNREAVPMLIAHAKQLIEHGPTHESDLTDRRLAWMLDRDGYALVLDAYLAVQDQFNARMDAVKDALPKLTQRIHELPDSALKIDAVVAVAGAKLAVGDVEGGRLLAQHGFDLLERVSEPWAASTVRLILADCLVMQGEYREASELMALTEEVSYAALDVETRSVWAALHVFIAAVTRGETHESHIELARRQQEMTWEGYGPDLPLIAECELARVRGDHRAVLKASAGSWADHVANTRHGFLTYRAHALISLGQYDEAVSVIEQLANWRGVRWQEYWGSIDWLRARLAQNLGDALTARWHYEAATLQRHFPLPFALTLADYGEFLKQQGESGTAAMILSLSVETLESLGASGYLPRVQAMQEHLTINEPSAQTRENILALLTSREQQIVDHLAKGRSNSQIAESLVVSVTTVRSHVSNVLRKMQLSSRGEVARVLRESDQIL